MLQALQPQLPPLLCLLASPARKKPSKAQSSNTNSTADASAASGNRITGAAGTKAAGTAAPLQAAGPKLVIGSLARLSPQCQVTSRLSSHQCHLPMLPGC